jgi:hypothetical protein
VDVEDEDVASRCAMEATDRDGIREMPTATPNPPEVGGVVANQLLIAGRGHRESECWKKRGESGRTASGSRRTDGRNR